MPIRASGRPAGTAAHRRAWRPVAVSIVSTVVFFTALGWVVAPIVAYAVAQTIVSAGDALYRSPAWSAALLLAGALLGVGSANARIRGGVINIEERRHVEFLSRGPVLGLFRPGADVQARVHRR